MIKLLALIFILATPMAQAIIPSQKKNLPRVSIARFINRSCAVRLCINQI